MAMMKRILALAMLILAGCATVSVVERPVAVPPAASQQSASAAAPGAAAVAPGVVAAAQAPAVQEVSPRLTVGEKLTYDVRWLGLSFGRITSRVVAEDVINGRRVYVLEAIVKSKSIVSLLTKGETRYVSYMDAQTLCSLRQEVYEGGTKEKKISVLEIDQTTHRARYQDLAQGIEKTFDVPERAQDILTLTYLFRLIPLAVGDQVSCMVVHGSHKRETIGLVASQATVRLPAWPGQEKIAFVMYPLGGKEDDQIYKGRVRAYYDSDPKRTPLLALVKVPVFSEVMVCLVAEENMPESSSP
jgi:hypothetical protein